MMKNKKRKIKLCASSPLSANDFVGSCAGIIGADRFWLGVQEYVKNAKKNRVAGSHSTCWVVVH